MATVRLFFALDTPGQIRPRIIDLMHQLQVCDADVKWEPVSKLHCTVKFLGDTDDRKLPELRSTTESVVAGIAAPSVRYGGLGCFPSKRDPRVIWVGMDDFSGTLLRVQGDLEKGLVILGFPPDERTFHPHITLGRTRGRRNLQDLITVLESLTFLSESTVLSELLLVRSDLRPSGSVYTTLQAFPFTGH
jgi:2'-5' RNA ligase